jgi:uncharacterized protein YjbJ (UPF0337 family)
MQNMQSNEQFIKGKWKEIKGDIQKTWGKLTDDELEKTKGDMKAIAGLIQQRYGESRDSYSKKLDQMLERFKDKKDEAVSDLKAALKNNNKNK